MGRCCRVPGPAGCAGRASGTPGATGCTWRTAPTSGGAPSRTWGLQQRARQPSWAPCPQRPRAPHCRSPISGRPPAWAPLPGLPPCCGRPGHRRAPSTGRSTNLCQTSGLPAPAARAGRGRPDRRGPAGRRAAGPTARRKVAPGEVGQLAQGVQGVQLGVHVIPRREATSAGAQRRGRDSAPPSRSCLELPSQPAAACRPLEAGLMLALQISARPAGLGSGLVSPCLRPTA